MNHPNISPAATEALHGAADRADGILTFTNRMPPGARRKILGALTVRGLTEVTDPDCSDTDIVIKDGDRLLTAYQITDAGRAAIGRATLATLAAEREDEIDAQIAAKRLQEPVRYVDIADLTPASHPIAAANAASWPKGPRMTLRQAAERVLAAWDGADPKTPGPHPVNVAIDALRAAMDKPERAATGAGRPPRADSKGDQVLAMLRRNGGATGQEIGDAMGWLSHTVRGFLSGLRKKGINVQSRKLNKADHGTGGTVYSLEA